MPPCDEPGVDYAAFVFWSDIQMFKGVVLAQSSFTHVCLVP